MASNEMPETLTEFLSLRKIGDNVYESQHHPERMGNAANIAYGGCVLGVAVHAATLSTDPEYRLFSAQGSYLSGALVDRRMVCTVTTLRSTRTFYTCQVLVEQDVNGSPRSCLFLVADFQKREPSSLLEYSAPPRLQYDSPSTQALIEDRRQQFLEAGELSQQRFNALTSTFGLLSKYFAVKSCGEGVSAQNLSGFLKKRKTTQDGLALTDKTTADWVRTHEALTYELQCAALIFIADGALSFMPLTHTHRFLEDAGACSTLDFSMRVFTPDIEMHHAWLLREMSTIVGGHGRTYSEARFWTEDGKLVANMTQQSILRPKL